MNKSNPIQNVEQWKRFLADLNTMGGFPVGHFVRLPANN